MAKDVAKDTIPIVEKGVAAVYGAVATGVNLGAKEAKNVAQGVKRATREIKSKGGRKSRCGSRSHKHKKNCTHKRRY